MGFDYTVVLVRRDTSQIFSLGRQLLANSAKKIVRYVTVYRSAVEAGGFRMNPAGHR